MITFKKDIALNVVDEFDEVTDSIVEESIRIFEAGKLVDADICHNHGHYVDLQFGAGGGVAFGVQRSCFIMKR